MKKVIFTEKAPAPIGPYSQGMVAMDKFVFLSGQIPLTAAGELAGDDVKTQTHQVFANIKAALESVGCTLENVVKTTVFLKDMNEFAIMNGVYAEYFTSDFPARSAVEVARLPKDVRVEIELIAIKP